MGDKLLSFAKFIGGFKFSHLVKLSRDNPAAFNECRQVIINNHINSHYGKTQAMLRKFKSKLDCELGY